ncbi:MAG: glycosyltransferase family 2 protein [Parabacteroides sp.]|nr:glycosyltransferase family 2 protein [Parabacteroides sp.]
MELLIKRQIVISKLHEYANESLIQDSCVNSDQSEIVVSLTSYDKRIYEVYLVIESLLHQTIKPYKIILWLSKDEFCYDDLPIILKKQQNRGLEIKFCDDLKSYKKLLPTLREYSSYDIVTVDDDFIYPYDFIENLLKTHIKNPNCICYYRGARMSLKNGKIQPYLQWCNSEKEYIPSILNFATGCGGILYPIGCFNASVFDENLIFELAPYADDIWFKSMALLNGVKYVKVQHPIAFEDKFIPLESMQDIALYHQNVNQNRNDVQMQAVFEYFKLLLEE